MEILNQISIEQYIIGVAFFIIGWMIRGKINSLQQIKGNVIEEDRIFIENCNCKNLIRTREGFKCFDCGKELKLKNPCELFNEWMEKELQCTIYRKGT